MKKSKIVLALMSVVVVLLLAVVQPLAIDPPDFLGIYEQHIDLSTLTVLTGAPSLQDENQWFVSDLRTVFGLGSVDFSNYSKISISYSSPPDALFGEDGSFWALLKSAEFTDYSNEENFIAKGSLSNAQGAWFDDIRSSTIDVSGIDYVGEAFLAFYLPRSTLRFMSMDITYQKVYTQEQVDAMLKLGILNNAEYNFVVKAWYEQNSGLNSFSEGYPNNDKFSLNYSGEGVYFKDWFNYVKDSLISSRYYVYETSINILLDNPINPAFFHLLYNNPGYIASSAELDTYISISQIELILDNEQIVSVGSTYSTFYHAYLVSVPEPDSVNEITNIEEYSYNIIGVNFTFTYRNLPITDRNLLNEEFEKFFVTDPWALSVPQEDVSYSVGYNAGYSDGYENGEEFQQGRIDGLLSDRDLYWRSELDKMQAAYNSQTNQMLDEYNALKDSFDHAKSESYVEGKKAGFIEGKDEGLIEGFNKGVSTKKDESLRLLIFSVFDAIGSFIFHFIGFDFLGINLLSLMTAIFTLVIFLFLLGWLMRVLGKL